GPALAPGGLRRLGRLAHDGQAGRADESPGDRTEGERLAPAVLGGLGVVRSLVTGRRLPSPLDRLAGGDRGQRRAYRGEDLQQRVHGTSWAGVRSTLAAVLPGRPGCPAPGCHGCTAVTGS